MAGAGLWEIALSQGAESNTDHAAKWETSNMVFFYPELVEMRALGDGPLAPDMKAPDGIGGPDPRKHASAATGRRNVELASRADWEGGQGVAGGAASPNLRTAGHRSPALVDDLTSGTSLCGGDKRSTSRNAVEVPVEQHKLAYDSWPTPIPACLPGTQTSWERVEELTGVRVVAGHRVNVWRRSCSG